MMDTQKKRSSLFNLQQFRDRWADMRENYQLHKDKGQPLNKDLFIASYDQEQIIGTAIFPNQVNNLLISFTVRFFYSCFRYSTSTTALSQSQVRRNSKFWATMAKPEPPSQ
jgi:hypothetical protein